MSWLKTPLGLTDQLDVRLRPIVFAVVLAALAAVIAFTQSQQGDYVLVVSDNNPALVLDRLAGGDLAGIQHILPAMGAVSMLVRLPFVALAGDDVLWQYRAGSFACLLALVGLAYAVMRAMQTSGRAPLRAAITGLLIVAGPVTFAALNAGHPEELLGGALCVGAVLAALADRRVVTAILLGLAVGTKQWGVVAILPVIFALPGRRIPVLASAAALAAAMIIPGALADLERYRQVSESLGGSARVYFHNVWWPVSEAVVTRVDQGGGDFAEVKTWALPFGLERSFTATLTLVLVAASALLGLIRGGRRIDPLGLLTALLVLRCALDPVNMAYYFAPAAIALATWDGLRGPGRDLPVIALLVGAGTYVIWHLPETTTPWLWWLLWAVVMLPLLALAIPRRTPPTTMVSGAPSPS